MWTEENDKEPKYGKLYTFTYKTTLYEDRKVRPLLNETIWPHWSEGVPTKLRRRVFDKRFDNGKVQHKPRDRYVTIEFNWNAAQALSTLKNNYHLLPGNYENEWRGVYRIFLTEICIDRLGGKDPTGTLYIGRAGSKRGWSTLRYRVMKAANLEHHAIDFRDAFRSKFSHNSLAVEWAYTSGRQSNHKGEPIAEAVMAENWLLWCYSEAFGEYPPWNERG